MLRNGRPESTGTSGRIGPENADIKPERIEAYQKARLTEGAKRATVNREMAYLRRGFRLLMADGAISRMPAIRLLQGETVREGFINRGDFDALLANLPAEDRDIVAFLYHSAWRSGEAKTLQWRDVDLEAGIIRLRSENSKNKRPRTLPLAGELRAIIERRAKERRLDCLFVFHRNGKPIKSFRKAFTSAAAAIGMPQLIPHDLRRSAVRNFRRAGISETEGMLLSGHKTNSIYKRYDIVDENDLREAAERVQAFLSLERDRKVAVMGSKG